MSQGLVKGVILCFRNLYFYFRDGESTSRASQLTSPASQKSKDLNKVPLLLQYLDNNIVKIIAFSAAVCSLSTLHWPQGMIGIEINLYSNLSVLAYLHSWFSDFYIRHSTIQLSYISVIFQKVKVLYSYTIFLHLCFDI